MMTHPECTVVIDNDLTGTRRSFVLPTDANEAMENCVALQQAFRFADQLDCLEQFGPVGGPDDYAESPLAVTIRKTADIVRVHWWASGDEGEALQRFREIEQGRATV